MGGYRRPDVKYHSGGVWGDVQVSVTPPPPYKVDWVAVKGLEKIPYMGSAFFDG